MQTQWGKQELMLRPNETCLTCDISIIDALTQSSLVYWFPTLKLADWKKNTQYYKVVEKVKRLASIIMTSPRQLN